MGYKYKRPGKRGQDSLREQKFLMQYSRDPVVVQVPIPESHPCSYTVTPCPGSSSCGDQWNTFCVAGCQHSTAGSAEASATVWPAVSESAAG